MGARAALHQRRGRPSRCKGDQTGDQQQLPDQRKVERRTDVLVYTGEQLVVDLEVTGTVSLDLWAASSAADCDSTARLTDVAPDGTSTGIVDGIVRARYRNGLTAEPLTPGQPEKFGIVLGPTSHIFRAGHALRLQVASSNHPRFDRNPQQLVDPARATEDDLTIAEQTVFHDADRPSQLLLMWRTVRPDAASGSRLGSHWAALNIVLYEIVG